MSSMFVTPQIESRFWSKVDKSGSCWEWIAGKHRDGYGQFKIDGKTLLAHRVAYFIGYKHDPIGFCVCHSCDNPGCVNPNHLWLGSNAENIKDRQDKGREAHQKGSTHGRSKLTESDILEIRWLAESGMSQSEIGKRFDISQPHVSYILSGRFWSHV